MTRREFLEDVTDFYDLRDFCWRNDCYVMDDYDVIDDEQKDDRIHEWLRETDEDWSTIRDILDDVPTGYDFYRCDGWVTFYPCDDSDFDDVKSEVLEWADDNDVFEDSDEEDDDEEIEEETADPVDSINCELLMAVVCA